MDLAFLFEEGHAASSEIRTDETNEPMKNIKYLYIYTVYINILFVNTLLSNIHRNLKELIIALYLHTTQIIIKGTMLLRYAQMFPMISNFVKLFTS